MNCVGQYLLIIIAPPSNKKLMISSKHECLGEVIVVIDPTFVRMHRV